MGPLLIRPQSSSCWINWSLIWPYMSALIVFFSWPKLSLFPSKSLSPSKPSDNSVFPAQVKPLSSVASLSYIQLKVSTLMQDLYCTFQPAMISCQYIQGTSFWLTWHKLSQLLVSVSHSSFLFLISHFLIHTFSHAQTAVASYKEWTCKSAIPKLSRSS